jgi:hypothetical protein
VSVERRSESDALDNACGDHRRRLRLGEGVNRLLKNLPARRYAVVTGIGTFAFAVAVDLIFGRTLGTAVGTGALIGVVCGAVAGASRTSIGPKRREQG